MQKHKMLVADQSPTCMIVLLWLALEFKWQMKIGSFNGVVFFGIEQVH